MVRGEILIDKELFMNRYSEEFANPRAFVSGTINADYDKNLKSRYNDLGFVIYELRINDYNEHWKDKDWTYLTKVWKGSPFVDKLPKQFEVKVNMSANDFRVIYDKMLDWRTKGKYPLDGFVIKPLDIYRLKTPREYPKDCVAIKFKPQLSVTEVDHIEWK